MAGSVGGGEPPRRLTALPCGVRVVSEPLPALRSLALGVFIAAGSIYEPQPQAGISHLLEHLLFRGTAGYSSAAIDQLFDELGATANAETDKEYTVLSCRLLDSHLERALPAMLEMVFAPLLSEVDAEREVILQELAAYEDDPQELVFDHFAKAVFGEHPLGRPVIGSRESLAAIDRDAVRSYHARTYRPERVVVAAAGSVDHDRLVGLVGAELERLGLEPSAGGPHSPPPPNGGRPQVVYVHKPTEQYHICVGGPGLARNDPRRFALRVAEVVLGATPSSRLFQEVRERRGLAYAIYSFSAQFATAGEVGIYFGTDGDHLAEAVAVVGRELEKLAEEGPTAEELRRAKECAKSATVLALESSGARMGRVGSAVLLGGEILEIDELLERIEAVDREQVRRLCGELLSPGRLSVAAIGPSGGAVREALGGLAGETATGA